MTTSEIENYPGFPDGIGGPELMALFRTQAERFGARVLDVDVERVDFSSRPFRLWAAGVEYRADTVIVATGASALWLGIESETRLRGRGVSACATCDGFFHREKKIMVVGGGDSAMEEAVFLTRFGSVVTVVHRRDEFRASKIMLDRARANPKIKWITSAMVEDVFDAEKGLVTGVRLRSAKDEHTWEQEVDGFFVAIGHIPNTAVFQGQIELDAEGYVVSKGGARTSVEGVFHAGDVEDRIYRQAITAAGAGCRAAIEAERFLER